MTDWVDQRPEHAEKAALVTADAIALDHQSKQIFLYPQSAQPSRIVCIRSRLPYRSGLRGGLWSDGNSHFVFYISLFGSNADHITLLAAQQWAQTLKIRKSNQSKLLRLNNQSITLGWIKQQGKNLANQTNLSYIRGVDGLRAISILAVLAFHGLSIFKPLFGKSGWLGVDVFFVISGFLITRILLNPSSKSSKTKIIHFFYNRVLRIMPAFLVMLSCYLITNPSKSDQNDKAVAIALFNLADYDIALKWTNILPSGLGFCWSLSIEEKFYILLPLILIAPLTNFWKIIALIGGCLIWKAILIVHGTEWLRIAAAFDTRYDELLIGCLCALVINSEALKAISFAHKEALSVLALATIFIGFHAIPHPSELNQKYQQIILWCLIMPGFCTCAGIILLSFCHNSKDILLQKFLQLPPINYIGKISYSLYLWHGIVFSYSNISNDNTLHQTGVFLTTLLTACTSFMLFEKPLQKFRISR